MRVIVSIPGYDDSWTLYDTRGAIAGSIRSAAAAFRESADASQAPTQRDLARVCDAVADAIAFGSDRGSARRDGAFALWTRLTGRYAGAN